jgi:eukaryotic-like serine/threonine-protein kinase
MSQASLPPSAKEAPSLEIAHVLFMDVVAYSRLPMEEQSRLLALLQKIVRDTADVSRALKRRQLLLLPTGDGMALVFFGDPEAPAHCAVEISRALKDHGDLGLRMGLHTGPVQRVQDVNANRNVSGGGINTAQRVMDCGDAGHILMSKSVADVLGQMSSWTEKLHDLGEAEVKHGIRVHLYNLYTDEAGNPALPQKLRTARKVVIRKKRRKVSFAGIGVSILAGLITGGFFYSRRVPALTDKDTIVLADFVNKTGDTVFDDTLKQGLSVSLSQSPFLNFLTDRKASATMKMMGRHAGDRLTEEVAREVCVRTGSKAMLSGSIARLGSQYVIGLKAVNCQSGDALAQEQVQAAVEEEVLKALDKAATSLRKKLGESLSTVQKYDVPLVQASTPSLQALQALSEGIKISHSNYTASLPFFKRAIELDPQFARAYTALGSAYFNLNEHGLANGNFQKAYDLRERASELEKYHISAYYYSLTTEELDKANQVYERWALVYPRDSTAHGNLGLNYFMIGKYEKAAAETIECLRLNPDCDAGYSNLVGYYAALGQLDQARAAYDQALARKLDNPALHGNRYYLAFLQGDAAEMQRQVDWAVAKPEAEDLLLTLHSDTEAYSGRLGKAQELSRRAAEVAKRNDQKETAALWLLNAALREAEIGNAAQARKQVTSALALTSARELQILAALALARAGDTARADRMADDLQTRSPLNTLLNGYWLPTIRASLELTRKQRDKAVDLLRIASAYELATPGPQAQIGGTLYPVYVRGEAYLKAGQGLQAAGEFQKLIDHRSIVANSILGALAHLQLGRAKVMSGDQTGGREAYQDFLALWKDADPDIPILKQAKAEYAKLH